MARAAARRFARLLWGTIFAVGLGLAAGAHADTLTLAQARLGNVFLDTETVEIPVRTDGDSIDWSATDFFGVPTRVVSIKVGANGQTTIRPELGRRGYFALHVAARRAGRPIAQADTSFAVIAPSSVASLNDSPFGVMTHFAQGWNTDLLPLIARAGLRHIRDEQYWQEVEPVRGKYVFDGYARYMAAVKTNRLDPLMELTFGNNLYDHDPATPATAFSPCTDDGRAGYAAYGDALLDRYGLQVNTVEVWNEYNGTWCNGPATADPPGNYAKMLRAAFERIKTRHPGVRVVGGAAVLTPLPWFEDLCRAGALDYMDAMVIHPYRDVPEGVEKDVAALRDLSARYNHDRGPKAIWATECGEAGAGSPGKQDMARYLVRLLTLLRSAGVERVYWYLMRDYNEFATGLLRSENDPLGRYTPTSAYPAYATLIRLLGNATVVRREPTDPRTRMYLFAQGGGELRVAWSTAPPSQIVLTADAPLTLTNIMGESQVLRPVNGKVALTIGQDPIYLAGPVRTVRETGRDVLLADSADGFAGSQADAPGSWSYHYYDGDPTEYQTGVVRPMTWTRDHWGYRWECPYAYAVIDANHAHPSLKDNSPVWVVRRWHGNTTGAARISGSASRAAGAGGDGTGIKIFVDGVEMFSRIAGAPGEAATVGFDLPVTLKVGSLVDFVVTPGPGSNIDYDDVRFDAQVSQR